MPKKGFSLIEILIVAVISSIVMIGITQLIKSMSNAQRRVNENFDLTALKSMLLTSVSCSDSIPGGGCTPGALVPLAQRISSTSVRLLATNTGAGTDYGHLTVRAECATTGRGILVRATRLSATGTLTSTAANDFEVHPFKNSRVPWSDPGSLLFDPGIELCGSSTTAPSGVRVATLLMSCDPIAKTTGGATHNPNNATNRIVVDLTGSVPVSVTTGTMTTTSNCTLGVSGAGTPGADWQSAPFDRNRPAYFTAGFIGGKIGQTYGNLSWSPQIMTYYNPANGYLTTWLRDPNDNNHDATISSGSDIAFTVTAIQP